MNDPGAANSKPLRLIAIGHRRRSSIARRVLPGCDAAAGRPHDRLDPFSRLPFEV
jgi:hypothetical protein